MSFKLNDNILLTLISHRYNLTNTTTSEASDQAAFKFHFKIRHPMPTTNFEKVFFFNYIVGASDVPTIYVGYNWNFFKANRLVACSASYNKYKQKNVTDNKCILNILK